MAKATEDATHRALARSQSIQGFSPGTKELEEQELEELRRKRRGEEKLESKKSCVSPFFSIKAFLNEHYNATRCLSFGLCCGAGDWFQYIGSFVAPTGEQLD